MQRIELGFLRVSNFLPGESARSWGRDRSTELLEVWVGRRKRSASFIRTGPRSLTWKSRAEAVREETAESPNATCGLAQGVCVAVRQREVFALCARSTFLKHHAS